MKHNRLVKSCTRHRNSCSWCKHNFEVLESLESGNYFLELLSYGGERVFLPWLEVLLLLVIGGRLVGDVVVLDGISLVWGAGYVEGTSVIALILKLLALVDKSLADFVLFFVLIIVDERVWRLLRLLLIGLAFIITIVCLFVVIVIANVACIVSAIAIVVIVIAKFLPFLVLIGRLSQSKFYCWLRIDAFYNEGI